MIRIAALGIFTLGLGLWIWIAWRNYVRWITNVAVGTTPAMVAGVSATPISVPQLLARRVFPGAFETQ